MPQPLPMDATPEMIEEHNLWLGSLGWFGKEKIKEYTQRLKEFREARGIPLGPESFWGLEQLEPTAPPEPQPPAEPKPDPYRKRKLRGPAGSYEQSFTPGLPARQLALLDKIEAQQIMANETDVVALTRFVLSDATFAAIEALCEVTPGPPVIYVPPRVDPWKRPWQPGMGFYPAPKEQPPEAERP